MDERLRLVAELQNKASAELRRLTKDFDKVKPNAGMIATRRWMDDFQKAGQKAAEVARPLPGMLSALGVGGIAAGLSIGEMVKQFRDLAAELPKLKELGRESGMSETEIKRLAYAARMLNADGDKMGSAIGAWSEKMLEFRQHGGRTYTEILRQNSDLARKMASESPAEAFKDWLGWLSRIPDAAMKARRSSADAVQIQRKWLLEGGGSDDLMPMLAKGAQGLADAYGEAAKNVAPITPELEKQAEALNQALNRFDQTWSNFKLEMAPTFLNGLTQSVDKLDQVFKLIQAHPVESAIGAGGAAALLARNRIMARSSTFGLRDAATRHMEAAAALKGSAASLAEAAKAGGLKGGGGMPQAGEGKNPEGKPDGKVPSLGARVAGAAFGLAGIAINAPSADVSGDDERQANHDLIESLGQTIENALHLPQLRDYLHGRVALPGEDDRETRARSGDRASRVDLSSIRNFDGNALRRNDEMPLVDVTAKKDTADAVKTGTLAAWREMAQQNGLGGNDMGVGAPSLRYGRGADGQFRRGGHSGGGRNWADTPDGAGHAGNLKAGMGMRAMAAMKYLVDKKGWTPEGAAIAVGNAMQESSVSPNASGDPSVPGGSHHMFQWNRERLAAFRSYAAAHGKSVLDFETNLDFFDEERKRRSGLESQWDKQKDLHNAGRLGHLFEGYGDQSEGKRVQNARDALDLWKKQHPGSDKTSSLSPDLVRSASAAGTGSSTGGRADPMQGELHVHLHEGRVRRMEAHGNGGLKLNIRSNPTMTPTAIA